MNVLKKYLPHTILKVFSYTAVATLIKMVTVFISLKIITEWVGAEGVVMLGQLTNFSSIILVVACGGISSGITKYIAEYKDEPEKIKDYITAASQITAVFSIICALLLIFTSNFLSEKILLNSSYSYVFMAFAITVLFYAFNGLFIAVVNGFQDYRKYVLINISNSIIGLIFTLVLVWYWRLEGMLISAVTYQSVVIICTVLLVYRQQWFRNIFFQFKTNAAIWKQCLRYGLMTFTTAATVPVAQLIIRGLLVNKLSMEKASWWEGVNRISTAYLAIFVTSFTVYYLPKLSEIKDKHLLKAEVLKAYRVILPILFFIFLFVYALRKHIILLLFNETFLPMESLFVWQLAGDFLKISGWLIGFIMVAKTYTRYYIFSDIFFNAFYVILSYLMIDQQGVLSVMISYNIVYFCYLFFMMFFFSKVLK